MRKSCGVTDVVKTFRKHTKACLIDLINFDWNQSAIPAGSSGFTECFDNACDVTRFSHSVEITRNDFLIPAACGLTQLLSDTINTVL